MAAKTAETRGLRGDRPPFSLPPSRHPTLAARVLPTAGLEVWLERRHKWRTEAAGDGADNNAGADSRKRKRSYT
jgi:hypothetical protein